jgi:hypothetical protein
VGIRGVFSDKAIEKNYNFSLFEAVTGNFNSLLSRKNSLFFLSPDSSQLLAKRTELCSMPCGAARE